MNIFDFISLFSRRVARRSLADALQLDRRQRADLAANPDKFIDDNFGADCCGVTRAMLGGGPSVVEAFKSIAPMEVGMLVLLAIGVVGFIFIALRGGAPH